MFEARLIAAPDAEKYRREQENYASYILRGRENLTFVSYKQSRRALYRARRAIFYSAQN